MDAAAARRKPVTSAQGARLEIRADRVKYVRSAPAARYDETDYSRSVKD
jgi:hypothetical protein